MKHDDSKILQEIQRNTRIGMTAIETILDKIEEDEFALQLSRQSLRYSEIHNRALDQILENKGKYSYEYSAECEQGTSGRDDDTGKQQGDYQYVEGDKA